MNNALPVIVIGAGPVGLAAAAHLLARGLTPLVLEAGARVGAGMRRWAHVLMFSPWEFTIDKAARELLERHGWQAPDPAALPTGGEVVLRYLEPLAALPEIAPHLRTGARVVAVSRQRTDRMKDVGRDQVPFVVRYVDADGEHEVLARAVIDASGTIETPNPAGASGLPALGERALGERIFYGIPDVQGRERARYAGQRVLVVGSGHSAFNVLIDLARLAGEFPDMRIHWAIRRDSPRRVLGGGENDQLRERGQLGLAVARLIESGALRIATGFHLDRLQATPEGIVAGSGDTALPPVDEVVVSTGFRPDLGLLSELRIAVDAGTQAPVALAPLIDPNLHSCGSVRPHGAEELKHPDADVYIVGMKSYGRAPTFLLLTGYEQVRSVAAAIDGDWEAARRVELVLPETGVCITQFIDEDAGAVAAACCGPTPAAASAGCGTGSCGTAAEPVATPAPASCGTGAGETTAVEAVGATVAEPAEAGCCGGPAPAGVDACCVRDADAKASGASGCGCGPAPKRAAVAAAASCCG